jgi:hypothetical protein
MLDGAADGVTNQPRVAVDTLARLRSLTQSRRAVYLPSHDPGQRPPSRRDATRPVGGRAALIVTACRDPAAAVLPAVLRCGEVARCVPIRVVTAAMPTALTLPLAP